MKQDERSNWIDRTIRDAQERGLFDNLDGAGRPIDWEDESLLDEDWVMAFRLMREQGFAPEWIELHKEIDSELKSARDEIIRKWSWRSERFAGARESQRRYIDAEWQRAYRAFAESIAELNRKIADFNLVVPIVRLQKFKLDLKHELDELGIDP
jgi:DnaJ family protein C protein 28